MDFCVRLSELLVPAFADDGAIANHDRTDERIRFDVAAASLGEFESTGHEDEVGHRKRFSEFQRTIFRDVRHTSERIEMMSGKLKSNRLHSYTIMMLSCHLPKSESRRAGTEICRWCDRLTGLAVVYRSGSDPG